MPDYIERRLDEITTHLERIEAHMAELALAVKVARANQIKGPIRESSQPPPPPPILVKPVTAPPEPMAEPAPAAFVEEEVAKPPSSAQFPSFPGSKPRTKSDNDSAEYLIGAKLLPKVGAAMMVIGTVFLVAWGYSSGVITKQMIFGLEVLGSVALIGLGLALKEMRERFDELVTGIGCAGLYATFIGGKFEYNLYGGPALVGLTTAVSALMMAICFRRKWSGVGTLGVIGGFLSSTMPYHDGAVNFGLILHFIFLVTGAAVVIRSRREVFTLGIWVTALTTYYAFPWADNDVVGAWAMIADGVVCAAAVLFASEENYNASLGFGSLVIIHSLLAYRPEQPWFISAFCAAMSLVLYASKRKAVFGVGFGTALAAVAFLVPACYKYPVPVVEYGVECLVFAILACFAFPPYLLGMAAVSFMWACLWAMGQADDFVHDSALVSLLIAAGMVSMTSTLATKALSPSLKNLALFYLLPIWFLWTSLATNLTVGGVYAISLSWTALATLVLVAGAVFKQQNLRLCAFGLFGATTLRVVMVDMSGLETGFKVLVLMALGAVLLAVGYAYTRKTKTPPEEPNPRPGPSA
ncbi:MAG: DUF2339 domain-containing protein [Armatimonadetes bacterium]|nr:DUF2339 domain-containing protein [Armatimonadota bacterium]